MTTPQCIITAADVDALLGDSADVGDTLDSSALEGMNFSFVCNIKAGTFLPTADGGLHLVMPVPARVDSSGVLCRVDPLTNIIGAAGVPLLADDPSLNLSVPLQWHVLPDRTVDVLGTTVRPKRWWFNAPADGVTTSLASLTPVNGVAADGLRGFPGDSLDSMRRVGDTIVGTVNGVDIPDPVDISDFVVADWSVVNTKGDLIVGTADNAVARQAVGSNDQVLTADSAQTNGLGWATLDAVPDSDFRLDDPRTPIVGSVSTDKLDATLAGLIGALGSPKAIPVSLTSAVVVSNTTTATDLITMTLSAGVLVPGTTFRIRIRGTIQFASTSGTLTFRPFIGAIGAAQQPQIPSQGSAAGPIPFHAEFDLTVRTTGASGTYIAQPGGLIPQGPWYLFDSTNMGTAVVDTTAATPVVKVAATWATANASNILTIQTATIEQVV